MYPDGSEVLVVDDDRDRRERISQLLADEGFAVTAAAEGLAALRAIGVRRYTLIIAAEQLPGSLNGATTVRQARTRQPWLKALYVTNAGGRPYCDDPDADDAIFTPFERHELIGCVFELMHRGAADVVDLARRARTELRAS